jgi:hypothetical protein
MSLVSATPSPTAAETIFQNLNTQLGGSFAKFQTILSTIDVAMDVTVTTQDTSSPPNILYQTVVKINNGAINTFKAATPDANDEYWQRHNALVDQAVQARTQIILKIVDAVGGIAKIVPV